MNSMHISNRVAKLMPAGYLLSVLLVVTYNGK
jgi:hypothetical protein